MNLENDLQALADPDRAKNHLRYFKTGPGQYAEGDQFMGITVPQLRLIAKQYDSLSLSEIRQLLTHSIHEKRLLALIILVKQFQMGDSDTRKKIAEFYIDHRVYVNNWDLVDASAHLILGAYLHGTDSEMFIQFSKSESIWDRRIAIISSFYEIKIGHFETALRIADLLIGDSHDLIQKAVGWMLREIGNRDLAVEEKFLKSRYKKMPRTMLRYAIEKFPEARRQEYLKGVIR